jgi:hypothetical protein
MGRKAGRKDNEIKGKKEGKIMRWEGKNKGKMIR